MRSRPLHFHEGDETLTKHADALLGAPRSADAIVRIMVTLPSDAATNTGLVEIGAPGTTVTAQAR